ncbi:MAG TPA: hypothetical protein ENN32_03410 [Chloroflexi bacterium]|nr:hypothetical protein [Chloroflexota bacterium]
MSLNQINFNRLRNSSDRRSLFLGVLIVGALILFEVFNFSTTHFALQDLLGDLKTLGIRWATLLSLAFCAIDFAGISRMFSPEQGRDEPREIWFLFGAWLLAATMNASLTWWGVSMAISNHSIQSAVIIDSSKILQVVPLFVAILVWVIRVLVIGTIGSLGEQMLWGQQPRMANRSRSLRSSRQPVSAARQAQPRSNSSPARFSAPMAQEKRSSREEPVRINAATAHPPVSAAMPRENAVYRPNRRFQSAEPTYHQLNTLGNEADNLTSQSMRKM